MAVLDKRIEAYNKQNGGPSFETWAKPIENRNRETLAVFHETICGSMPPKKWTKSDILINVYHAVVMEELTPKQRRRVHHKIRHIAAAGRTKRRKFRLKLGAWNRR